MPPATDWKEQIPADETERFERHAAVLAALQQRIGERARDKVVHRALHAKSNLGVEAEFEVLATVPQDARIGLFATPRTYPAFVRFSNGAARHQPDPKPDVRGLAVKILGVDGKKLIPGLEDATTQDFLAIRTSSIPMRDADEFISLVKAAQTPALLPFRLIRDLGFRRALKLIKDLVASMKLPLSTLASTSYYSALPIKYGPYAVRFAFVAQDAPIPSRGDDPTYIGDQLAARLRERPVIYDFRIQFYQDETRTPIEDASVEWSETVAPYVTVARLTLPVQDPRSPRGQKIGELVERFAFDPWHARDDLRPLGNMMRARNHAYRLSTHARGAIAEPSELPRFD